MRHPARPAVSDSRRFFSLSTLWLWGPAVLQMIAIFSISAMSDPGPLPGDMSDKSGHFIGYAILGALVLRALAGGRRAGLSWRAAMLAVVISGAYGVTDEFHQSFVPGRTPDVMDALADTLGAATAAVVITGAGQMMTRPSASR